MTCPLPAYQFRADLAEGLNFGRRVGLDPARLLEIFQGSAAASSVMPKVSDTFVVRIESTRGAVGWGEANAAPSHGGSSLDDMGVAFETGMAHQMRGQDALQLSAISRRLEKGLEEGSRRPPRWTWRCTIWWATRSAYRPMCCWAGGAAMPSAPSGLCAGAVPGTRAGRREHPGHRRWSGRHPSTASWAACPDACEPSVASGMYLNIGGRWSSEWCAPSCRRPRLRRLTCVNQ